MSAHDPFASAPPAPTWRFLHGLNPLAKIGAFLPAMVGLIFVRDLVTPAAFIVFGYGLILLGARMTRRTAVTLFLVIPSALVFIGCAFSLWVDASRVHTTTPLLWVGPWTLYSGALEIGFATGLRLVAIIALSLVGGLTTTGPELVHAMVQQLRVPYRIGYTALAAYRFVPRFGYELQVIRSAHRVRGYHGGRGPFARIARGWGYVVPLLAGAIRHAERVALAMDARAFGAHKTRTERFIVPFRARDVVFFVLTVAVTAALFCLPLFLPS